MEKVFDREGELLLLLLEIVIDGMVESAFEIVVGLENVSVPVFVGAVAIAIAVAIVAVIVTVIVVVVVVVVEVAVAIVATVIVIGFDVVAAAIPKVVAEVAAELVVAVHLSVRQRQQEVAFFLQSTFPSERSYLVVSERAYLETDSKGILCLEQIDPHSVCSHLDAGVSKVWAFEHSDLWTGGVGQLHWLPVSAPSDKNSG